MIYEEISTPFVSEDMPEEEEATEETEDETEEETENTGDEEM